MEESRDHKSNVLSHGSHGDLLRLHLHVRRETALSALRLYYTR